MDLLTVTYLAAIAAFLATLSGVVAVTTISVFVAILWGIYRRDRVFFCAFLLIVATMAIFALTADLRDY